MTASSAQAAAVSSPKVLDEGHIDFAARVVDGKLQIHLKDGTVSGKTTWRDLAAGGSVVCVLTALFALTWCLAPRRGLPARARRRRAETWRPTAQRAGST
ncbi:hypothetical protein ABZ357_28025 [Streptomyces sp. NPDC005917]|uniref:hypothetical protein n=1 Tax=unclassified Streptomyces TaxID=2593676 RepID=UPI0033F4E816